MDLTVSVEHRTLKLTWVFSVIRCHERERGVASGPTSAVWIGGVSGARKLKAVERIGLAWAAAGIGEVFCAWIFVVASRAWYFTLAREANNVQW